MSQPLSSAATDLCRPDLAALGLEAHRTTLSALKQIEALNPEAVDAAALAALKAELSTTLEHLRTATKTMLDGLGVSLDPDQGRDLRTQVLHLNFRNVNTFFQGYIFSVLTYPLGSGYEENIA